MQGRHVAGHGGAGAPGARADAGVHLPPARSARLPAPPVVAGVHAPEQGRGSDPGACQAPCKDRRTGSALTPRGPAYCFVAWPLAPSQAYARGMVTRKVLRRWYARRHYVISMAQAAARGHFERQRLAVIHAVKTYSCKRVQAAFRGALARRRLRLAGMGRAAAAIQRAWRCAVARQRVHQLYLDKHVGRRAALGTRHYGTLTRWRPVVSSLCAGDADPGNHAALPGAGERRAPAPPADGGGGHAAASSEGDAGVCWSAHRSGQWSLTRLPPLLSGSQAPERANVRPRRRGPPPRGPRPRLGAGDVARGAGVEAEEIRGRKAQGQVRAVSGPCRGDECRAVAHTPSPCPGSSGPRRRCARRGRRSGASSLTTSR